MEGKGSVCILGETYFPEILSSKERGGFTWETVPGKLHHFGPLSRKETLWKEEKLKLKKGGGRKRLDGATWRV